MHIRAVICDDCDADRSYIKTLVEKWAMEKGNTTAIEEYASAESFLFAYAEQKEFDILLLDIEMQGMDGVSMAKRIRKENETVQIIFISGYLEYIAEGYDVAALHYLLKPVDEKKLFETLDRAQNRLAKNEKSIYLKISGEMVCVLLHEIHYIEVRSNYVTVHAKQDYSVKKTLKEFEEELDDRFFKIGRSFILNLNYIERVGKTTVYLSDGAVIPLPRGAYELLNRSIIARL